MENIILSVVVPCYNHGKYIKECIDSILIIGLTNIEIIVINDGSTDNGFTKSVLDTLSSPFLKVFHQQNQGLARTRNNAIEMSKGKYILPLDADNYIDKDFLTNGIKLLEENTDIDIAFPDRILVFENNKTKILKTGDFDILELAYKNNIDACAIYRKSVWTSVNGYSEDMPVMGYEDWDFWLKCTDLKFKFHYLKDNYFFYRVLGNSMIKSAILKRDLVTDYLFKNRNNLYKEVVFILLKRNNYFKRKPFKFFIKLLFKNDSYFN